MEHFDSSLTSLDWLTKMRGVPTMQLADPTPLLLSLPASSTVEPPPRKDIAPSAAEDSTIVVTLSPPLLPPPIQTSGHGPSASLANTGAVSDCPDLTPLSTGPSVTRAQRNSGSGRPEVSYSSMIVTALLEKPNGLMTLQEIYAWIMARHPYYAAATTNSSWKNSIRHSLALSKHFERVSEPGQVPLWRISPNLAPGTLAGLYAGNRRNRASSGDLHLATMSSAATTTGSNKRAKRKQRTAFASCRHQSPILPNYSHSAPALPATDFMAAMHYFSWPTAAGPVDFQQQQQPLFQLMPPPPPTPLPTAAADGLMFDTSQSNFLLQPQQRRKRTLSVDRQPGTDELLLSSSSFSPVGALLTPAEIQQLLESSHSQPPAGLSLSVAVTAGNKPTVTVTDVDQLLADTVTASSHRAGAAVDDDTPFDYDALID